MNEATAAKIQGVEGAFANNANFWIGGDSGEALACKVFGFDTAQAVSGSRVFPFNVNWKIPVEHQEGVVSFRTVPAGRRYDHARTEYICSTCRDSFDESDMDSELAACLYCVAEGRMSFNRKAAELRAA